ncbi:unnamed protein product [Lactuca virosa]|uniref:FRIGIDA-like protein n=1 Tax=Lactuca virosa TaxID=75947 RepID=A0AAU9MQI2_9ASTR|nr:unnamed protein product [Lactuca virosa]
MHLVLYTFMTIFVVFVSVLSSSQNDISIPTLVSLVASLPLFQCPFAMTSVPAYLEIVNASDEESLDRARTCLMERMHLLNEVSARTQTLAQILSSKQLKFDECFQAMKKLRQIYEQVEEKLRKELSNLNHDLQLRADDEISQRSKLSKELEEQSQQFDSLKLQYTLNVSQLEIAFSGKDFRIKLLENELSGLKTVVTDKIVQLASLSEFHTSVEEKELQDRASFNQEASNLQWVIKEGIPSFVWALMNSIDFGDVNAALQTASIQLGLHQTCSEMKEKYVEALDGKNVLYSYSDAQRHILDRFSYMITHKYFLFGLLEGDKIDDGKLKKELADLDPILKHDGASSSV